MKPQAASHSLVHQPHPNPQIQGHEPPTCRNSKEEGTTSGQGHQLRVHAFGCRLGERTSRNRRTPEAPDRLSGLHDSGFSGLGIHGITALRHRWILTSVCRRPVCESCTFHPRSRNAGPQIVSRTTPLNKPTMHKLWQACYRRLSLDSRLECLDTERFGLSQTSGPCWFAGLESTFES